jgi:hypothetical protein
MTYKSASRRAIAGNREAQARQTGLHLIGQFVQIVVSDELRSARWILRSEEVFDVLKRTRTLVVRQ